MTDATDMPTPSQAPTNTVDCVIDVDPGGASLQWVFAVFVLVVHLFVLGVMTFAFIGKGFPWYGTTLYLGFVLGIYSLMAASMRLYLKKNVFARVTEVCRLQNDDSTANVVRIVLNELGRSGVCFLARALATVLPRSRGTGYVIRCCPPESRSGIDPITVPFEPMLLVEGEESTLAFQQARDLSDEGLVVETEFYSTAGDAGALQRKVRRWLNPFGIRPGWLAFFWIFLAVYCLGLVRSGRADVALIVLGAVLLLSYWKSSSARTIESGTHWFVIPGGLLVRSAGGWLSRKAALVQYQRSEAVLVMVRAGKGRWWMSVGNGESHHFRSGTDTEVSLLLRSWLSPVAPLPIDRYSDFGDSS